MTEAKELKIIPFSQYIPRYPGELPLQGPPGNPEESIFNNPDLVQSAIAVCDFISPVSNSDKRRAALADINNLVESLTSRGAFEDYVRDLKRSSGRSFIFEELMYQLKGTVNYRGRDFPDIPTESSIKVSNRAISIVNDCLKAAYPEEFGSVIPKLTEGAVKVIPAQELEEYRLWLNRSIAFTGGRKAENRTSRYSQSKSDVMVMNNLPGRPIFFSDKLFSVLSAVPDFAVDLAVASLLLHENMHRATREQLIVLTPANYSEFFDLTTSSWKYWSSQLEDISVTIAMSKWIEQMKDYVLSCQPEVRISGEGAILYGRDHDGVMRQVAISGYDLEEEIVELLLQKPLQKFYSYIRKNFPDHIANSLVDIHQQHRHAKSSYVRRLSTEEVKDYLVTLGLSDDRNLLTAHSKGEIPLLHLEKHPGELYGV